MSRTGIGGDGYGWGFGRRGQLFLEQTQKLVDIELQVLGVRFERQENVDRFDHVELTALHPPEDLGADADLLVDLFDGLAPIFTRTAETVGQRRGTFSSHRMKRLE